MNNNNNNNNNNKHLTRQNLDMAKKKETLKEKQNIS